MAGDVTITTQDGNPPPPPPPPPASHLVMPAKARLGHGKPTLRVRCDGAANCVGTLRIESRASGATRRVTYAIGAFSIPAGATRSVTAKLAKAGRKALKRHRSLTAYANATFQDGRVTSTKITLRR